MLQQGRVMTDAKSIDKNVQIPRESGMGKANAVNQTIINKYSSKTAAM